MNKKDYNKIANKNREAIAIDFINFMEEKNLLDHFKSNIICGFTFGDIIGSGGDPKLYFSLYSPNYSITSTSQIVKIIEEWKALMREKYNLIY